MAWDSQWKKKYHLAIKHSNGTVQNITSWWKIRWCSSWNVHLGQGFRRANDRDTRQSRHEWVCFKIWGCPKLWQHEWLNTHPNIMGYSISTCGLLEIISPEHDSIPQAMCNDQRVFSQLITYVERSEVLTTYEGRKSSWARMLCHMVICYITVGKQVLKTVNHRTKWAMCTHFGHIFHGHIDNITRR